MVLSCFAGIKLGLLIYLGVQDWAVIDQARFGQQEETVQVHSIKNQGTFKSARNQPRSVLNRQTTVFQTGSGQVSLAHAASVKGGSKGKAEDLSQMGSLSQQWQVLKQKQQELRRKQRGLQELEKRIDQKLAQEAALKNKLEAILKEVEVLKNKKIKHLVDVYSNMEPKQAAKVLETLDEKLAVKILAGMRGRTAGEILSFVQAEKAAKLSEALTAFQTPFGQ